MPALSRALAKSADKRWWSSTNATLFMLIRLKSGDERYRAILPLTGSIFIVGMILAQESLPTTYRRICDAIESLR
jgi:hypothetical protein